MQPSTDHSRILNNTAKKVLAPLGCKQKGRSRLWFDDQKWRLTVIEFQPSSWSKGSYLNVGVMWLWNAKEYWSFDEGYRVESFVQFKSETQFSSAAESYAERAAQEVLGLRERYPTIEVSARLLRDKPKKSPWDQFHTVMACLACSAHEEAASAFNALMAVPDSAPWVPQLKERANQIWLNATAGASTEAVVFNEIAKARTLLKLPPSP
jgi:Domain of unknown function (DUF4304)